MKKKSTVCIFGAVLLAVAIGSAASAEIIQDTDPAETQEVSAEEAESTGMIFENGMAQPMLTWSDFRAEDYTNEGSDILRFCVYVETDNDTDNDGMADLIKVFLEVPRAAAEGDYKAAAIYDPTPYDAGNLLDEDMDDIYENTPFDYDILYKDCEKRTPVSEKTTLEAAQEADPGDWNYTLPDQSDLAYYDAESYNYYLVRGFAVVLSGGVGTIDSEGFELCGRDLERDSHKCVVEWLAGNRRAYTDKTQNIEIKADWGNGSIAMSGCSYGGTMVYETATTGVEGLKTVIPSAGIASWYDYTNAQGISLMQKSSYTDYLGWSNSGGSYVDDSLTELKPGYGSYLWQTAQDEIESNGDYSPIWEIQDYSDDDEKINCSALVVQGLNDFNVNTRQADMMVRSFEKAGQKVSLVLHQEAHQTLEGREINGELWDETLNKWLSHYLYGVDNGIENMAEVTVQSNVDGSWKTYDSWREFTYVDAPVTGEDNAAEKTITSAGIAEYSAAYLNEYGAFMSDEEPSGENYYYLTLDDQSGAFYLLDLPENTTIYGAPEIHAKLSTEDVDKDGLMITAVLVDSVDENTEFPAFVSTPSLEGRIPVESVDYYETGGGAEEGFLVKARQIPTKAKVITYAWTDLDNPGCGEASSEYVYQEEPREAGKFYDYTFYMLPTVYTLAPGHHLELVLTTWDPYRVFLDEEYELNPGRDPRYSFYTYGYTIDNNALKARIPVR